MSDAYHIDDPVVTLNRDNPEAVKHFIETANEADLASYLDELQPEPVLQTLLSMPLQRCARVFSYMRLHRQAILALQLDSSHLAKIVTEMNADDRADLFNHLSPVTQQSLLRSLAQTERDDIRLLAAFAEDTAGAIMTSDYATLAPALTSQEAIEVLRREAPSKETIYRAYVVDQDRRLIGSVQLQDLILSSGDATVFDLMEKDPLAVALDEDREVVAQKIGRYDVLALPVVDAEGKLVGIVTYDDAYDVLQEETTEDFHKIGTIGRLSTGLRDVGVGLLYRKRITWLALLIFGNLFSGAGIAYFEDIILAHVALVFFLPLLIDSSGNAGSQAATLMVRALATGDVVVRDWGVLIGRELLIAIALGVTMALIVAPIGFMRGGVSIAIVVALTMVLVVVIGSLVGMSLPFLLSRVKLDPATASAPLVTTVADSFGVIVYFSLAAVFLMS